MTTMPVFLQVLQLRRFQFAIDLRQRLKATHGEQRMAQPDENCNESNSRRCCTLKPAQRPRRRSAGLPWKETVPAESP